MLWRYPNRTALEPGVRLLPEVLKKAGYQTCHIGKWHVTENPLQNGMDINIAGNHIGHPKSYFSPYGMEIWKNGPEGEFLMIGYFFRVGCFWHKNNTIFGNSCARSNRLEKSNRSSKTLLPDHFSRFPFRKEKSNF